MLAYAIRRVLILIPILLIASIFTFVLVDTSSDPVEQFELRQRTNASQTDATEEDIQAAVGRFEEQNYYDRSMPERYWLWLTGIGGRGDIGILQGEFGPSVRGTSTDIGGEISSRFMTTLRLVLAATIFSLGLAMITGVISAIRQYHMIDYVLTFIGFVALSMPIFWIASLIKDMAIRYNDTTDTQTFQTALETSPFTGDMSTLEYTRDIATHLILPTLALMLAGYAAASRFQRSAMLDVLNSDYVRLAKAKGLRNRTVMRRHALRTALMPMATLAPIAIVGALSGAVITETVFEWRGLGRYFLESLAVETRDPFAIQAFMILVGTLTVIGILISDLLYGILDPRVRYE